MLYLDALLNTKRFDDYFGYAIEIIQINVGSEFAAIVIRNLDLYGMPKTKEHLDSILASCNYLESKDVKMAITSSMKIKSALVIILRTAAHLMEGI